MKVAYEHKPAMILIGYSTSIRPEEGYQKCPEFWDKEYARKYPGSLQSLNTQVWQEWYPNEGRKFMANGSAMLEVYSPGDMQSPDYECGIWVPICKPAGESEQEAAETVSTMTITGVLQMERQL